MMISKGVEDINIEMPKDVRDSGKHESTFDVYLTAVVRDDKGNIIKVHKQRSHTATNFFIELILPKQWYQETGSSITITNRGGTSYSITAIPNGSNLLISYPNSNANYATFFVGIFVGSGQQSNPYSAHSLAAQISSGSGAGQLIYQSPVLPSQIMINGNSAYFYIEQTYINQSGGTITITEVGVFVQIYLVNYKNSSSTNTGYIMMWYDVLSSSISVPNGGSVTIYYTFTVNP